jgi:hypothetical protein
MKEVVPEGPSAQVGSKVGGGSQADDAAMGGPGAVKGEVVSISSGEPSIIAEVA